MTNEEYAAYGVKNCSVTMFDFSYDAVVFDMDGVIFDSERATIDCWLELAEKYNVTDSAIAVAWILRHPAGIQTIIGTTNKDRIAQISKASHVHLTREEWYRLYMAAGNRLP